jgi:hypothetical protein
MAYANITTWLTGILNGYKYKEQALPNSIVYSVLGTSTLIGMLRGLGNLDTLPKPIKPAPVAVGLFVIVPMITGATYFLGNQMGQALKYVEDKQEGVTIKLF